MVIIVYVTPSGLVVSDFPFNRRDRYVSLDGSRHKLKGVELRNAGSFEVSTIPTKNEVITGLNAYYNGRYEGNFSRDF